METEEMNVVPTPAPAPAPTADAAGRLNAAREFAKEQYEKVVSAAAEQMQRVGKYTEDARRQIHDGWDVTCDKVKEIHKAGEEYVKENPTGCVLGAFGVGIIFGLLLGISRR